MKPSGTEMSYTRPIAGMAGITQEAQWPIDLYIWHVANIFEGHKYHAANSCSVW